MSDLQPYNYNLSLDDKKSVLEANYRLALELKRKMDSKPLQKLEIEEKIPIEKSEKNNSKDLLPFDDLVNELYQVIINISNEEELNSLIVNKISYDDSRFSFYINLLKLRLYSDLVSLSNMAYEDESEMQEINRLYCKILTILNCLDDIEEENELIVTSKDKENRLFFMQTSSRVVFFDNMTKDIPFESYSELIDLLNSIKYGSFKGLKRFKLFKSFEVTSDDLRIIFVRLRNNEFLILNTFVKKFMNTSGYREMLTRINNAYLNDKDWYLEKSLDEEFINKNIKIYDEIIQFAGIKGRRK